MKALGDAEILRQPSIALNATCNLPHFISLLFIATALIV